MELLHSVESAENAVHANCDGLTAASSESDCKNLLIVSLIYGLLNTIGIGIALIAFL